MSAEKAIKEQQRQSSDMDMAASKRSIRLAGKEYTIRPLDDEGYAEFEQWVQDAFAEVALRNAQRLIDDPIERTNVMQAVLKEAATLTMASEESLRMMATFEGAVMLTWLYLRRDNLELTRDEVKKLLTNPTTLAEAMAAVNKAEGWVGLLRTAMTDAMKEVEAQGKKVKAITKKKKRSHRDRR